MKFPYPVWIREMPEGPEKNKAKNRFCLRLACLYAHPNGRIGNLAKLLGINENTLKSQVFSRTCYASPEVRQGIRDLLGDKFVPPNFERMNGANHED